MSLISDLTQLGQKLAASFFDLDDLAARSRQEIRKDKDRSLTGSEPGLVGYWPMSEGKGDRVDDRTSHGHAGTIHGATWSTSEILRLPPSQ